MKSTLSAAVLIVLCVWGLTLKQEHMRAETRCESIDGIYVKTVSGYECVTSAIVVARETR
jgi:plastocyanin domain-containing protein